ncbi:Ribonuclease III domain [Macleaya cordata]|uniref:Ribonuclease III domain n=1 Tax=Macleaya cordata TaxID=56857 RepID=A0A200PYV6_MACCD|nr:Ribonuclease III domain [Macleaya cordata]
MALMKEEENHEEMQELMNPLCWFLEETHLIKGEEEQESKLEMSSDSSLQNLEAGLEEILGYKFNDKSLIREALTHPSFYYPVKLGSYERLEFIGDAVLNLLVAKKLFFAYPELCPGPLTRLRAANVDNEKLARVAIKHGLHQFLRHKASPHLEEQVQEFKEAIVEYPVHSNGLIDTPKFLADIVESTIGAIYVDSNCSVDTVWKVFKELLKPIISLQTMGIHPVTELLELCQKKGQVVRFVKDSWKENACIDVYVDDILVGSANYGLKKEIAQNRAAKAALAHLKGNLSKT